MSTRFSAMLEAAEARLRLFAAASGKVVGSPGELGTAREDALRGELQGLFPAAFHLSSGFVLAGDALISSQQDTLIHDTYRYPTVRYADGRILAVPESVYGVISVRSRIRPTDLDALGEESVALKDLISSAIGKPWRGATVLFGYQMEGAWDAVETWYFEMVARQPRHGRLDLICVPGRPLLLDSQAFGLATDRRKTFGGMAGTATFFVPKGSGERPNDMMRIEPTAGAFAGLYQLLLTRLSATDLSPLRSMTLPRLVETPMRAEEVFVAAGVGSVTSHRFPKDIEMTTTCPTCKSSQTLAEATTDVRNEETVYTCKNGCQAILIVGAPGNQPWPGRGYRMGDYSVRNPADLFVRFDGSIGALLFPASPAALMNKKGDASGSDL